MIFNKQNLNDYDQDIAKAIAEEDQRQEKHIELIASENYTSPQVMMAQGSKLTNKYAEGYPNKRYYGGCEHVDTIEEIAIERAKKLFNASYVNVQPHSGSQANAAVYHALVNPGDTIMGMSLADGGHLTHGAKVSFSGKIYNAVPYGLDPKTELLDYDNMAKLAKQHKPKLIMGGFSAYSRIVDWNKMREIADQVGAYLVVDMAHIAGLVAASVYPSPVDIADVVTSTTHKTLRGPRGGLILSNKDNEEINKKLNSSVFPGNQGGPLMHVIAAKAICFKEAFTEDYKIYQQQVVKNARVMADEIMKRSYHVISNGTDNHLLLISLIKQNITGKAAEISLGQANITVNKNAVPADPQSPFITSGIRIGTAAITSRGFKEEESKLLANWIADILDNLDNKDKINKIKQEVESLCKELPVYP